MNIARKIELARQHLRIGNSQSYAQVMSGMIRSAASKRAAQAFKAAVIADGAQSLFRDFESDCPTARNCI